MEKVFCFIMICLWAIGSIGGTGYACFCHAYPIAVGCIACGWMAWPKVDEYRKRLMA